MRRPRFRVLTMLFLVAVIAFAFAGLRWWWTDPTASRLEVDSVAVLVTDEDEPGSRASVAVYPLPVSAGGGRYVLVGGGSRVTVLDDSKPSVVNTFMQGNGVTVEGEDRDVKITVLDGQKAGFTGYTSRFFLRPAE